ERLRTDACAVGRTGTAQRSRMSPSLFIDQKEAQQWHRFLLQEQMEADWPGGGSILWNGSRRISTPCSAGFPVVGLASKTLAGDVSKRRLGIAHSKGRKCPTQTDPHPRTAGRSEPA